jgi:hypothetical protein
VHRLGVKLLPEVAEPFSRLPRFMRRLAVLALVLPLFAAAGCGSDKGSSSSLDEGLRYLPADSPFAVAIDTDLNGGQYRAAGKIADKFAFSGAAEEELKKLFERGGDVDFDRDVKPLLGNPFVVGAVDAKSFSGESNAFVGAIQVEDGDKLKDLVDKSGADEKGEKEGAKLYEDDSGDTFAVKDNVLVVAGSTKLLEEALARRNDGETLTEDKFESALADLPKDALVRAYFNLGALLKATSGGRQATKVKWVAALRTLGLAGQAKDDSASLAFNLKTDPDGLSDKDLPLATGDSAPQLVQRAGELGVGLRDPGQIVEFAIDAASATEGPAVDIGKRQIERQLGIDVEDDVTNQLTGDTSLVLTPSGKFGVRAELKDPAAFKKTLAKMAGTLPQVVETLGGDSVELSKPKPGEDFYALAQADGGSVVFGVSHGVLVASNDPASARRLATASPSPVSGAKGSLVLSADAEKLADAILKQLSEQLGPLFSIGGQLSTGALGDLTGAVRTSTSGMKGSLELKFD